MKLNKYLLHILVLSYMISFVGCVNDFQTITSPKYKQQTKEKVKPKTKQEVIPPKIVQKPVEVEKKQVIKPINNKIAIVFPSKIIGKWAFNATNSAINYLIYKNNNFQIKVFDSLNEKEQSIKKVFSQIAQENISKVLVLFTYNGALQLTKIDNIEDYDIYLPLIHKDNLDLQLKSVVYGSIDYSKQFDSLLNYTNGKVANFYDKSTLGKRLSNSLNNKNINLLYSKEISNNNARYSRFINTRNKKLQNSTLFLNTPIVKSSIILSQLQAKDVKINQILSTQLNYTSLILSLTQKQDRKNILIANSISHTNNLLEEYNALLDNDIIYNWVNYSTTIGIQYLIEHKLDDFKSIKLENNQINYPVELFRTTDFSLQKI